MKKIIFIMIIIFITIILSPDAYAQQPSSLPLASPFGFGDITSLGGGTYSLVNPIFEIAAVLVIMYFLFGAFKYLKAGGNKEDMEGARQMITQAIIGFVILIFAYLILQYIVQYFNLSGLDIIR